MTGVGGLAAAGAVVRAILRWSALAMSPWIASHAITESASAGAQDAGVAQLEEAFRAQGIHLVGCARSSAWSTCATICSST
jgi:hypothetical protein